MASDTYIHDAPVEDLAHKLTEAGERTRGRVRMHSGSAFRLSFAASLKDGWFCAALALAVGALHAFFGAQTNHALSMSILSAGVMGVWACIFFCWSRNLRRSPLHADILLTVDVIRFSLCTSVVLVPAHLLLFPASSIRNAVVTCLLLPFLSPASRRVAEFVRRRLNKGHTRYDDIRPSGHFAPATCLSNSRPLYSCAKRASDLLLSTILLILLSPLILVVAAIVFLTSSGSPIFVQERIGVNGVPFRMYKFRSMHRASPHYHVSPSSACDPRITPVGRVLRRTSLDELPQLINVLRGDMSLVGPRPEMPFIVNTYTKTQRLRLQVTPGLTGLWQLSTDRVRPIHENLHHDLLYIRERSLSLDLAILIHTAVCATRGV